MVNKTGPQSWGLRRDFRKLGNWDKASVDQEQCFQAHHADPETPGLSSLDTVRNGSAIARLKPLALRKILCSKSRKQAVGSSPRGLWSWVQEVESDAPVSTLAVKTKL